MKSDIYKMQVSIFKEKLVRCRVGCDKKRRIVMNSRSLYTMLQTDITYAQFCKDIRNTPLRMNIDYYENGKNGDLLLNISAVQAVFVMSDTEVSWQLHHALTDLILNNFSDI